MSTETIVAVRNLRKIYQQLKPKEGIPFWQKFLPSGKLRDEFVAVDDVSFAIQRGEIFGLLGPNGAGKTTTIKMLCTLLEPTAGTATVCGYDVVQEAETVRQRLGAVLTGERSIYWKLTGRENLHYFAALYHIPPAVAKERIDELLTRFELTKRADELVETYSTGMKQRIAIAKALLAKPPVILLDEPTLGLDPQAARNLRELILELKADGHTILLTTHYMEEADQLSDRIGIIDGGKIIALDTSTALKASINQLDVMQLEVANYDPGLTDQLTALPTVTNVATRYLNTDSAYSLAVHTTDSRGMLPLLIETIGTKAGQIRHMQIAQPTLEDVFIALTGKQLRE
ncbi:MAG TPA: ATP-binding cassette domain-containing protein [Caldilineaceae bacterium]|nr:ATP-binding cassette domain-containing protein [Caldilineaceae bacterium]